MKKYYDFKTKNKSFIKVHEMLKEKGVKNNKFFLQIINKDLIGVDPYDPNLSKELKAAIVLECKENYWYYLREVARICSQSEGPILFKLNLANLASGYCISNNINIMTEVARLNHIINSINLRILYENLFFNNSSRIFDAKYEYSKEKIDQIITFKNNLPSYIKDLNNLKNIKAEPPAKDIKTLNSLCHGNSSKRIFFDNFCFMKYNQKFYTELIPYINTIADSIPHGIIINSSLGDLKDKEAFDYFTIQQSAVKFHECFYDIDLKKYKFPLILIRYNYQDLELDNEWYEEMCSMLENDQKSINNEILMNWTLSKHRKEL